MRECSQRRVARPLVPAARSRRPSGVGASAASRSCVSVERGGAGGRVFCDGRMGRQSMLMAELGHAAAHPLLAQAAALPVLRPSPSPAEARCRQLTVYRCS